MARKKDKEKALQLRRRGKSYSQIKEVLNVSKSTLSYWLQNYPLPPERVRELRDWSEKRIENYRETRRKQREARFDQVYKEQEKLILPLLKRSLFVAGLFLYWGEGTKARKGGLEMSNTDPAVARFFIRWLKEIFNIKKNILSIALHLYSDMDIKKEIRFWSKTLSVPEKQFTKPYIKKTRETDIKRKGVFGHGTCCVRVNRARLAEKVLAGIKIVRDYYGP